jgi:hypothetical protein
MNKDTVTAGSEKKFLRRVVKWVTGPRSASLKTVVTVQCGLWVMLASSLPDTETCYFTCALLTGRNLLPRNIIFLLLVLISVRG